MQGIRESGDNGYPAVLREEDIIGNAFQDLAESAARQIAIRNAKFDKTKKVEITT